MSRIDGLTVQGIRSFAPDHREVLSLYTPLTLIVGSNGSGKTTIIECLKYATTGELPPNTKNGAFIHDPKVKSLPPHFWFREMTDELIIMPVQLCNEKLVLANVGMKFTSIGGIRHVLHRKMQVSVAKSGKMQFKTIEASLKAEGYDPRTKSERTKEVDKEVSDLLGVSPAILDSVIFCHQDESLWPMSEPSALKKKFDEIFEAQRYTKLIEQLKIIRKKRGEMLRLSQVTLKDDEINMKRAKENSKAIEILTADIDKIQSEISASEERIDSLEQREAVKREEAHRFLGMVDSLGHLQEQVSHKRETIQDLRDTITIMSEGDDELGRLYRESDARLARLEEVIKEDETQYQGLGRESKALDAKLNFKLAERGRLESDKEKYERQLQKRVDMIQHAATKHNIRGFSTDIDEDQVQAFNNKIQAMFNTKRKDHEKLEKELSRVADEARNQMAELETKKISLTSARASAKNKRAENDRRIKRLQTQADSIDCDEGHITILEKKLSATEENHQTTQKEFDQGAWDGKIQVVKSELAELENKSRELNSELVNYTRLSSERAQLDLRKKELKDREGELESLVGTHAGRISKVLHCDFNIDSVGSDSKSVVNEQSAIVKEEQTKCDALTKEMHQRDFELSEVRKRHAALVETKKKAEHSVLQALKKVVEADAAESITVDDFQPQYEEIEESKDTAEKDMVLFDEMKSFYATAQTYLLTKNKCHLCDRGFEDEQAKMKLTRRITKGLDDKMKAVVQNDFHEANKKFVKLSAVRADYLALPKLEDDISKLKKEADAALWNREDKLHELEAAEQKHGKAEEALTEVESVSKSVSDITQLHAKIQDLRAETDRLQSQSQLSGSGRSADQIHDAQTVNSAQIKEANKNLDNLIRERQRLLDLISNLAFELSENRNKLVQAKQLMNTRTSLFKEIKTLKEDNQIQEGEVATIDQDLKSLQPQIDSARGQRDAELERGREKARLVAEERDLIANTVNTLKMIDGDIQDYEDSGKAAALASCERVIQSLQQQHDQLKKDMDEALQRINRQTKELGDGAHRKRNIADNVRFRKDNRDLDELERQIDEQKSHNAREDYERCMREVHKLVDERTKLTASRNTMAGNMAAKDESLKEKFKTHETFYKGAQETYKTTKITVETNKRAIDDVLTTSNVIDKAVMQYHSLKMEEINRIANELWRATYKGTDIDTIAIRSENETPTAASSSSRKSYNYRVTMVKSDTEMDMRGRCSAGQKVLASIIIRLALAESFGINCGLIALDEPTTNLDSENIKSLATSLHGIIKARQAQANFQLIVITHDEEFLRYMRCNEFCDFFYRVARDRDQKSTIKKDDISRITE
ncbi:unnamed protein product [Discula destructiva]